MKKFIVLTAALVFVSSSAFALIGGSSHDFSAETWTSEICNVCHTPHNADTTVADAPLWDHALDTTTAYQMYDNTGNTMDATVGTSSGISLLCLSCHDGTINVDAFGGSAGTVGIDTFATSANLGTDLRDDHPIGITYDAWLFGQDSGLNDPSGVAVAALLFTNRVECASCHDVHRTQTGADFQPMLRLSNTSSALCTTCHNK